MGVADTVSHRVVDATVTLVDESGEVAAGRLVTDPPTPASLHVRLHGFRGDPARQ